jgi:hypothetical protein
MLRKRRFRRSALWAIPLLVGASASAQPLDLSLEIEAVYWPGYPGGVQYRATVFLSGGVVPGGYDGVGSLLSPNNVWAVGVNSSQTLTFSSLAALKTGMDAVAPWTITFFPSSGPDYVASIPLNIDPLAETEFPLMSITSPPDGAGGVLPTTALQWTAPSGYGDGPFYLLNTPATPVEPDYSGGLPAGTTSYTPPAPLGSGMWGALVSYTKLAPSGIGFQVAPADASLVSASGFLLDSASSGFNVIPEPSTWAVITGGALAVFGLVRRISSERRSQS